MIKEPTKLSSEASYLLAGGLGGLGRSISRWIVYHGAKHLIFVSRSVGESVEAKRLLDKLEIARIQYEVIKCDIADATALSTEIEKLLKRMPPIHGVIQAAMVLKDQVFANMTYENFITQSVQKWQDLGISITQLSHNP